MIVSEKIKLLTLETRDKYVLHICKDLFRKWSFSQDSKYQFQCGDFCTYVSFHPVPISHSIGIHPELMKECRLPDYSHSLTLHYHKNSNIVSLGIFIGLVTEVIETDQGISFGSIQAFSEELATFCESNHVLFYVFSLRNFDSTSSLFRGFIWNGKDWNKFDVPTPHVVHNRIHSRRREKSLTYEQLIKMLKKKHIPFFNDHFLNKWESYQRLLDQEHLLPYLPETELLLSPQNLENFLLKYEKIFLKPIHGSQGKKIIRIEHSEAEYFLDYTTFSRDIERVYPTILELYKAIKSRISKQAFIVQKGINLLRFQDRIIDFRFLCHLNSKNQWKVTSSVARLSSPNEFVSNIARGGEIQKVNYILRKTLDPKVANDANKLLHELALEVAASVGQSEDELFGELGIDLALDTLAKPWIIEINTKPSKNMDALSSVTSVRPSAKAIINYCLYLANPFQRSD